MLHTSPFLGICPRIRAELIRWIPNSLGITSVYSWQFDPSVISLVHVVLWCTQAVGGSQFVHLIIHHLQISAKVMLFMLHLLSFYIWWDLFSSWLLISWGAVFIRLEPVKIDNHSSTTVVYLLHSVRNIWQLLDHNKWTWPWSVELSRFPSRHLWEQYPDMISYFEWVSMYPPIIELLLVFQLSCCSLWHMLLLEMLWVSYCDGGIVFVSGVPYISSTGNFACRPNIR